MGSNIEFIDNIRFFEVGKPAPKGSLFKGIVTAESIFGSKSNGNLFSKFNYTNSQSKIQNDPILNLDNSLMGIGQRDNGKNIDASDLGSRFSYTTRYTSPYDIIRENIPEAKDLSDEEIKHLNKTFSSHGWLDGEEKIESFTDIGRNILNKNGNGALVWECVISLRDTEIANKYSMLNQNDYALVTASILPKFFKSVGLDPDNMLWWEDYHCKAKSGKDLHPHIHINFLEIDQTRTRGKFSQGKINALKGSIISELLKRQVTMANGIDYRGFFKDINSQIDSIKSKVRLGEYDNIKSVKELLSILPNEGRLQFNSAHMKDYRELVLKVVDELLNSKDLKEDFAMFENKLDEYDRMRMKISGDKNISSTKDGEVKKLKVMIANYLLSLKKDSDYKEVKDRIKNNTAEKGLVNYADYKKAIDLLNNGDPSMADAIKNKILSSDLKCAKDLVKLGNILINDNYALKDKVEAASYFEKASKIALEKDNIKDHLYSMRMLARCLIDLGEIDSAQRIIKNNIDDFKDPKSYVFYAKQIKDHVFVGDQDELFSYISKASALGNSDGIKEFSRSQVNRHVNRISNKEIHKNISSMIHNYKKINEIQKELDDYYNDERERY